MKSILSLIILLSSFSYGQLIKNTDIVGTLPSDTLYILDSIRQNIDPEHFPMTGMSYLKIKEEYAEFILYNRGQAVFLSGKINNPIIKVFKGDTVNVFTMITDNKYNYSSGKRYFFGISQNFSNNKKIYMLDQIKIPEFYIFGHYANKEEILSVNNHK